MDSGPSNVTTTTKSDPWPGQQPYLQDVFSQASQNYYGMPLVTPQQDLAVQAQTNRALQGNPLTGAAQQYGADVLGGNYLEEGNPYLDSVYKSIESRVMPSISSAYAMAGRGPSGAGTFAENAARGLGEAFAPFAFGDYQQERQLQQQMAQQAPELAAQDYYDISQLYGAGQQAQQIPWDQLLRYAGLIGGNYGGVTTSQQPYYSPSPFGQILGGGLGLLGMFA